MKTESSFDGLSESMWKAASDGDESMIRYYFMASRYDTSVATKMKFASEGLRLTGNTLCRALLHIQPKVMCDVGGHRYALITYYDTFSFRDEHDNDYKNVVPIDNQGEILTATDAGL